MYRVVFARGEETEEVLVPKQAPSVKGERLVFRTTCAPPVKMPVPGKVKIETTEAAYGTTMLDSGAKWIQLNSMNDKYVLLVKVIKQPDGYWLEGLLVYAPMTAAATGRALPSVAGKLSDIERVLVI